MEEEFSKSADEGGYLIDNFIERVFNIVFPKTQNIPAEVFQGSINFSVPFHVAGQFCCPELAVGSRRGPMLRAAMPEASINEHRCTLSMEHNVRFSRQLSLYSIPQSSSPKGSSECQLWACILPPYLGHAATTLLLCHHIRHLSVSILLEAHVVTW